MELREFIRKLQLLEQLLASQNRESVDVVSTNGSLITDITLEDDGSGMDNLMVVLKDFSSKKEW